MSSNLKVNTILPSTGTTVTVSGISSVTSSISAGSSITGTTFYGSGANLTSLPSQLTLSNNADNRVITGGSGVNLNGEANLTFDGVNINQSMSSDGRGLIQTASGNNYIINTINANVTSANYLLGMIQAKWNGTHVADISFNSGSDTSNKDDGKIAFRTSAAQGGIQDRLIIDSSGNIGINETSPTRKLDVNGDVLGVNFMFKSNSSASASIGAQIFRPANNTIAFATNGANTRLLINSNGDVTTTGATTFVRSNAGLTARAGDSVNIARANGTPLEIVRTGNNGQMINFFRDTTGVAQITWDGSNLTMGAQADPDILKVGSTITATGKFNVDYAVSGNDYVALFRNNNANCYGVSIQQPSSANAGYPLLSCSNSSGLSHFRVDSGGQVYANSGTGTEKKAYFVRAWVNFDGQGGSAGQNRSIQDSQNVSSVYDNDGGDFTINFATDMPTSAYTICGMASNWEATNADSYMITSAYKNATNLGNCRIRTIRARFDQHPPQFRDSNETMIAIIC